MNTLSDALSRALLSVRPVCLSLYFLFYSFGRMAVSGPVSCSLFPGSPSRISDFRVSAEASSSFTFFR